ncbi:MAG: hypothetical protein R3D86_12765 [Emcibacteraceae bacterium]
MHRYISNFNASKAVHSFSLKEEHREFSSYFYKVSQPFPEQLEKLKSFYKIWQAKINANSLPSWSDFAFEDFKGWHSNMRLIKYLENQNYISNVMVVGEEFKRRWGPKSLSERIQSGQINSRVIISRFEEFLKYINSHHYVIHVGTHSSVGISNLPVIVLELPLSENGKDVSHIISAMIPLQVQRS